MILIITNKHKYFLALCIGLLPFNFIRIIFYKLLLNYNISWKAKIGFRTIISVDKATIASCSIGMLNIFTGPFDLMIADGVNIGNNNLFECGYWIREQKEIEKHLKHQCVLRNHSLITNNHFFDITGKFDLGENSWVAGLGSQFWTHGGKVRADRDIVIGNNCYIASAVRFAQGVKITDNSLVPLGSIISSNRSTSCILPR